MPDICKCRGVGCNRKVYCYRWISKDSKHQAYFVPVPIKEDGSCEHYWPTSWLADMVREKNKELSEEREN